MTTSDSKNVAIKEKNNITIEIFLKDFTFENVSERNIDDFTKKTLIENLFNYKNGTV